MRLRLCSFVLLLISFGGEWMVESSCGVLLAVIVIFSLVYLQAASVRSVL